MRRYRLWDLDGTLTTDNETHFAAARNHAFTSLGHPLGEELEARAMAENLYVPTLAQLVVPHETEGFREQLVAAVYAITQTRYHTHLAAHALLRPGALEVLDAEQDRPQGVVTSAWPADIAVILRRLPQLSRIGTMVHSADTKPHQKPDPLGLVIAARRLSVPLADCEYIGDHWKDMEAAKRAGIPGILLRTETTTPEAEAIATHVIDDLRDLLALRT